MDESKLVSSSTEFHPDEIRPFFEKLIGLIDARFTEREANQAEEMIRGMSRSDEEGQALVLPIVFAGEDSRRQITAIMHGDASPHSPVDH